MQAGRPATKGPGSDQRHHDACLQIGEQGAFLFFVRVGLHKLCGVGLVAGFDLASPILFPE